MSDYNYGEFSTENYDFGSNEGPDVGELAPDFALTTVDGEARQLLDFDGDLLVLELGSITCPLFQSRRSGMEALAREFDDVDSAVLYVREAHPGAAVPSHQTVADKQACAARLVQEDGETRTVLVDDLEGTAHSAYGGMPNAVYVIDRDRRVRFRSPWNNAAATRKALLSLQAGDEPSVRSFFRPALPTVAHRTLANGGDGSGADFYRGLLTLIWNNVIKYNLRLLFDRG